MSVLSANNSSQAARGRHTAGRSEAGGGGAGRIALAVLLVIAFHVGTALLLLLFFGRRALESGHGVAADEEREEDIAFILPENGSAKGGSSDLYAWIAVADPRQWTRPDYRIGFSAGCSGIRRKYCIGAAQQYLMERVRLQNYAGAPRPLTWRVGATPESLQKVWQECAFSPVAPAAAAAVDAAAGSAPAVQWRRLDEPGRLLRAPVLPGSVLAYLQQPGNAAHVALPTLLEVRVEPDAQLPRVILRRSCGNSSLDRAAVSAVRKFFLGQPRLHFSRPRSVMLEADWFSALPRN